MDTTVLHGSTRMRNLEVAQDSMELQECNFLKSLQYDIDVPCILQWELLFYSAQSHLNEVLINIGALKNCFEKRSLRQWRPCSLHPIWEKTYALDCLLGNADGAHGTLCARVGVAA